MPRERIAELRRELAANPSSRQFYQLGELLRREGELAEAAQVLKQGLAHHPRYVAAWVSLGRAQLDLQELAEAQQAFRQALELDPQNPVAWRLFAETLLALGQRREALHAFQQALTLVPGDEVLEAAVASLKGELVETPAPSPSPPAQPAFLQEEEQALAEPPLLLEQEPFAELLAPPPPPPKEVFPWPSGPEAEPAPSEPFPTAPESLPAAWELAPPAPPEPPQEPEVFAPPPPPPAPPQGPAQPQWGDSLAGEQAQAIPLPEPWEAEALAQKAAEGQQEFLPLAPEVPPEGQAEDISLPAARAAVNRGDLAGAVVILQALLRRDPENQEAADLLALVQDMLEPLPPEEPRLSPKEKKIAALQRFLANLTLARERRGL